MRRAFWDLIKSDLEADPQRFDHILKLIEEIGTRLCALCPRQAQEIRGVFDVDFLEQMFTHKAFDAQEFGKICYYIMEKMELYCSVGHLEELGPWCAHQREVLQKPIVYAEWIPQFFEGVHGHLDTIEDQIRSFLSQTKQQS